jgi:hypothetical protein
MSKRDVADWKHKGPREYYPQCLDALGPPTAVGRGRGGLALWRARDGLFEEHLLRDEYVKHCVPRPHHDYFYSSVRFYVAPGKLHDTLRISGSLQYDGLKKLLTARCASVEANVATLYLAMQVATGAVSIAQAKRGDLYPRLIRGEVAPHSELRKRMREMKKKNHQRHRKQLDQAFADYAFDQCYEQKKKGGAPDSLDKLRNTRGESCAVNDGTGCCPHEKPERAGGELRYAATNECNVLEVPAAGRYRLHTCCNHCYRAMQKHAERDPADFRRTYVAKKMSGALLLKNRHTGVPVQVAQAA